MLLQRAWFFLLAVVPTGLLMSLLATSGRPDLGGLLEAFERPLWLLVGVGLGSVLFLLGLALGRKKSVPSEGPAAVSEVAPTPGPTPALAEPTAERPAEPEGWREVEAGLPGPLPPKRPRSLEEDDEPEEASGDLELPEARGGPSGGSLLERLRQRERKGPTVDTVVRPVPLELLAAAREKTGPMEISRRREASHRLVFEEYREVKESCGELIEGLDYERFVAKLEHTREALVSRFSCRDVRFKVYIKDGKASLKAVPVLDED